MNMQKNRPAEAKVLDGKEHGEAGIPKPWSKQEIEFLKEFYPTRRASWIAAQLDRTVTTVYRQANRLKLHRKNYS